MFQLVNMNNFWDKSFALKSKIKFQNFSDAFGPLNAKIGQIWHFASKFLEEFVNFHSRRPSSRENEGGTRSMGVQWTILVGN